MRVLRIIWESVHGVSGWEDLSPKPETAMLRVCKRLQAPTQHFEVVMARVIMYVIVSQCGIWGLWKEIILAHLGYWFASMFRNSKPLGRYPKPR